MPAADMLFDGQPAPGSGKRVATQWTQERSFSACLAAELGKGASVLQAFKTAHDFVLAGLRNSFALNQHVGPIYHKAMAKNA